MSTGFDYVQPFWEVKTLHDVKANRITEIGEKSGRVILVTNDPLRLEALVDRFAQEGVRLSMLRQSVIREDRLSLRLFEMQADIESALEKRGSR